VANKWIVSIPYEGTAYIPIEREDEPKMLSDAEIANKLHTNFMDWGMPLFHREKGKVERTDEGHYFDTILMRAKKEFGKKSSLANYIRKMASELQSGHFNPTIQVITKNNYGNEQLYVTSEHKDAIQALTGAKTLTPRYIEALKNLGFIFHHSETKKTL
jgi:hypothetical protein